MDVVIAALLALPMPIQAILLGLIVVAVVSLLAALGSGNATSGYRNGR